MRKLADNGRVGKHRIVEAEWARPSRRLTTAHGGQSLSMINSVCRMGPARRLNSSMRRSVRPPPRRDQPAYVPARVCTLIALPRSALLADRRRVSVTRRRRSPRVLGSGEHCDGLIKERSWPTESRPFLAWLLYERRGRLVPTGSNGLSGGWSASAIPTLGECSAT
jgi:hypothetical protein